LEIYKIVYDIAFIELCTYPEVLKRSKDMYKAAPVANVSGRCETPRNVLA